MAGGLPRSFGQLWHAIACPSLFGFAIDRRRHLGPERVACARDFVDDCLGERVGVFHVGVVDQPRPGALVYGTRVGVKAEGEAMPTLVRIDLELAVAPRAVRQISISVPELE